MSRPHGSRYPAGMVKSFLNPRGRRRRQLLGPGAPHAPEGESLCFDSLLAASAIPVMIVDAATGRIEECNPAAARVFQAGRAALVGSGFLKSFDPSAAPAVRGCLECSRETGRADARDVLTSFGTAVDLNLSLFNTDAAAYLLVHPAPRAVPTTGAQSDVLSSGVLSAVHEASIGFLVTDTNFRVEYANRVFLRMVNSRAQDFVRGQPIGQWLRMTAGHWARLGALLRGRRALEELSTILKCEHGAARGVRVAAVAVPYGPETRWGFCVRELRHLH